MSMVTVDKYRTLVRRLYDKTEEGKLSWKYDDLEEFVETEIAGNSIKITHSRNEDEIPVVIVTIINSSGVEVESFDDEQIKTDTFAYKNKTYYQLMLSMIHMAQRQATGMDELLDFIIDELE